MTPFRITRGALDPATSQRDPTGRAIFIELNLRAPPGPRLRTSLHEKSTNPSQEESP